MGLVSQAEDTEVLPSLLTLLSARLTGEKKKKKKNQRPAIPVFPFNIAKV